MTITPVSDPKICEHLLITKMMMPNEQIETTSGPVKAIRWVQIELIRLCRKGVDADVVMFNGLIAVRRLP